MTKLLWHSNSPWASTGYGQQTALFTPRLKEAGYELVISSFYGLEGNMIGWKGMPVLPSLGGTFGNEELPNHARAYFGDLRDGLVLTLLDVWVLDPQIVKQMNVCCWVPVDHDPAPPAVMRFFRESGAIPLAMSRFGEERLAEFDPIYVPHAIDTKAYSPVERSEARGEAGLPDSAFVVGMVAANKGNPSRKCFPEALRAFKAFRNRHSEAILCLHTEMRAPGGVDLPAMVAQFGLEGSVVTSDQYAYIFSPGGPEKMATVYSSFDVLLNPSAGEGFGLTPLEAQSCGVPVIVTDFSAMSEVCGAGWKVEHTPIYTAQQSWQVSPSIEDILESLEQCYRLPAKGREQISKQAREHAKTYDVAPVLDEHMLPALEKVQERFEERKPFELVAA